MRRSALIAAAVLSAACMFAPKGARRTGSRSSAGDTDDSAVESGADGRTHRPEHTPLASFGLEGVRFALPRGEEVVEIGVTIDGQTHDSCHVETLEGDVCIEDVRLDAGAHSIDVSVACRDPERASILACSPYSFWDRFVMRPRERVVLRLDRAFERPDDARYYFERVAPPRTEDPPCIAAIEAFAYAPSCNGEQVDAALRLLGRARERCAGSALDDHHDEAKDLLAAALWNHFLLPIERCFAARELRRQQGRPSVPVSIARADTPRDWWPRGTLQMGSWYWARRVLTGRLADDVSPRALMRSLGDGLRTAAPRIAVVAEIAEAYLDRSKRPALLRRAIERPWSLDVREPDGHRNFYVLGGDLYDSEYVGALATRVATDTTLGCEDQALAGAVVRAFLDDDLLTPQEWIAVTNMIQRTRETERLRWCDHAFSGRVRAETSQLDRLRWLARWDCSENRHPRLYGRELEPFLRASSNTPPEVRERIQQEFPDCRPRPSR